MANVAASSSPSSSAAPLTIEEIRALEQTRQRLSQLTNSLGSLTQSIASADPLPAWSSLQSFASIISQHLGSLSHHLGTHDDLFASTALYPLPNFPGRSQEDLLGQLLRKKLEPTVEDWAAEARQIADRISSSSDHSTGGGGEGKADGAGAGSGAAQLSALWNWAGMAANEQARRHAWGGNYTLEERRMGIDRVRTGLRRVLPDDDDDDDDDEQESDEDEDDDDDPMGMVDVRRKSGEPGAGVEFQIGSTKRDHPPLASASSAASGGGVGGSAPSAAAAAAAASLQQTPGQAQTVPPMPLNEHLKFLMTGVLPVRR